MGKYVIQFQHLDGRWVTLEDRQFDTLAEAQAAYRALPIRAHYRIAQAYTVTRYRPVREEG